MKTDDPLALCQKWTWKTIPNSDSSRPSYILEARECHLELYPRPSYCDRGRWELHAVCPGFPKNPNPIDFADMFPRLYFQLSAAHLEGMIWMETRNYTPIGEEADDAETQL